MLFVLPKQISREACGYKSDDDDEAGNSDL
jgi:hypothetical protein